MLASVNLIEPRTTPREMRPGKLYEVHVIITCADMRTVMVSLSFTPHINLGPKSPHLNFIILPVFFPAEYEKPTVGATARFPSL